ncbi:MAG: hypothetical protein EOP07_22260, partial [Proteobacteria bacterium]
MKLSIMVASFLLMSCMPRERQVLSSVPVPAPVATQLSPAAEQQIANCESNVQSTMTEFHLKNTDDSEATRKAEAVLF